MIKKRILVFAFLYICLLSVVYAQKRYNCYQKFMHEGRLAAQKNDFKSALEKFNSARRCDASKSDSVDIEVNLLFNQILTLKNRADANEKKAVEVTKELTKTLDEVEEEQAKNKRIIDAFYFYGDSLALACKDESGKYRYGFINKKGQILIEYKYDLASIFNSRTGYAPVKRDEKEYLLDAEGNEYVFASDIDKISSQVTALDLNTKELIVCPPVISNSTQLQVLLLYDNPLLFVPSSIGQLINLETLNLSGTNIRNLPKEIGQLINLQILDLRGAKLKELPREIGQLENLNNLNLSFNESLITLPEEIGQLTNLRSLDLSFNKNLKALPEKINQLTNLRNLALSFNDNLKVLPKEIVQLRKLQRLFLIGSNLQNLDFRGTKKQNLLSEGVSIEEFPKEICQLVELKSLSLMGLKLEVLPKEIGDLTKLESLSLTGTMLKSLPKSINQLVNLQRLNLSFNKNLSTLPKEISQLNNLKLLDLSVCLFSEAEKQKIKSWLPNCEIRF